MSLLPKLLKGGDSETQILMYVVIIAIVAGIATVAFIYIQAKSESYSALHIDSYSNYIENGTVSFTYGIDRFGPAGASYWLRVIIDDVEHYEKSFEMEPGSREWQLSLPLNRTEFPVKVRLILREGEYTYYETYFWLKGSR